MLADNPKGYLFVFLLCLILGINIYRTSKELKIKKAYLAFVGPLIAAIFPFKENSGDILSNMHEICAYISFGLTIFMTYINIEKYKLYNFKRGRYLNYFYTITLLVTILLYIQSGGVVAYEETLLLSVTVIINEMIYLFTGRK